jgi:glycosyltransferase involved in cell wall biosynthesis
VSDRAFAVAFDVTAAINGRTGIARYVTQLGAALERQGTVLRRFAVGRGAFGPPPGTRWLPVPARAVRPWWRIAPWPAAEQLAGETDVVHATGLLVPPTRRPLVITVHDVAAILHPNLHPPRDRRLLKKVVAAVPQAAAVLTVSHTTAADLASLGIERRRVFVAPNGFTPLPAPAPLPPGLPPAGTYLLTVGETSPRKGYDVALQALARVDPAISLVIAGPPAGDERRLRSLVARLGLESRVVRLPSLSDAELASLYADAMALCFPSIAEGFGLPVIEAMAAGLPVIASDIPIVRELAGDTAQFVNGRDPAVWAQAISTLASQESLRHELSVAARPRAQQFTWDAAAAVTQAAYRFALSPDCDARGAGGEIDLRPPQPADASARRPNAPSAPN